jgi:endoribonuclease Dicer
VLDVLMVFHIYEDKPQYDQGQMTDLLSSLVCNTTLSKVCTKLELHKALLYDSVELFNVLGRFFSNFQDDQLKNWCEDLSLERVFVDAVESDTPDKIPVLNLENKIVEAPKLLGDLVESVIGAIYLDSGENILRVWEIVWPWFEPFYTSFSVDPPKNPKAMINELYPGIRKMTVPYPGDCYRFIASITIATRNEENKVSRYEFKTVGRDRETAMEVSYGRALHFHKKFLANLPAS